MFDIGQKRRGASVSRGSSENSITYSTGGLKTKPTFQKQRFDRFSSFLLCCFSSRFFRQDQNQRKTHMKFSCFKLVEVFLGLITIVTTAYAWEGDHHRATNEGFQLGQNDPMSYNRRGYDHM